MTDVPSRISHAEAAAIIADVGAAHRMPDEALALSRCHGRILAEDIRAELPLPPFDNSAMDGFALRHVDLTDGNDSLQLIGEQFAGLALELTVGAGQCVRITTGAALPRGADTVVMKENTRLDGQTLTLLAAPAAGAHVRKAGEDVAPGASVLHAGDVLSPARIALASSLGLAALQVATRPTVAVFTTGDELVEPGMPLLPGQIYNSNRELLMGLLRADGLEPTAWPNLPDDPARMQAMLLDAGRNFDLVVTCGGVSAGEKDHIPELLQQHGRIHFWKVRMRPGMPLLFGQLGRAQFLGLPGNPVSVLATWLGLGRLLTDAMQGRGQPRPHLHARLADDWNKKHDRLEFLRGRLYTDEQGVMHVQPNPADGSHRMRGAADSDALMVLGEGARRFAAGDVVQVLPY